MPNTLIKVGAGIVGISSVTTGSYFIRGYYSTERINHRISKSGMTLLTWKDNEEEWAKRWREYVNNKSNIWNLKDYEQTKTDVTKVPKSFKDKCYYSTSTAIEGNEGLLSQIEKYCTKSFKVSDLLKGEKGIAVLERTDNERLWKNAWEKYFDHRKNNKGRDPLDITSVTRANLPPSYKDNCLNKANSQIKSKRDEKYSIVKSWCTKPA